MSVLLMGVTGFLGRRLTKKFDEKRVAYVGMSKSRGVDFTDYRQFEQAVKNSPSPITTIVNCACLVGGIKYGLEHTAEMFYINALITVNLFEVAHNLGINKIINPISNCSYPRDLTGQFAESQWWDGELDDSVAVYGLVRKMSYVQSVAYLKQYGMQTINLIVPNMYGPDDHFDEVRSHALGALVRKICDAKRLGQPRVVVWGTGAPVREWLYIDDCAEAIYRALSTPATAEPINLGYGEGISVKDLACLIAEIAGYKGELFFDTSKPDGAPYKVMNVARCQRYFGWLPATRLKDGIRKTVEWFEPTDPERMAKTLILNQVVGNIRNSLFQANARDNATEPYFHLQRVFAERGFDFAGVAEQPISDAACLIFWDHCSVTPRPFRRRLCWYLRQLRAKASTRDLLSRSGSRGNGCPQGADPVRASLG